MTRFFAIVVVLLGPLTVTAHPLPNLRYDRKVDVRLAPGGVIVRYTLELTYWTVVLDGKNLFTREEEAEIGGRYVPYTKKYAEKKAPIVAGKLKAILNGTPLTFTAAKAAVEPDKDHVKVHFEFKAPWQPTGSGDNRLQFEDGNFVDAIGQIWLTVQNDSVLDVKDLIEPFDLRGKSPYTYKPGEAERARQAAAV